MHGKNELKQMWAKYCLVSVLVFLVITLAFFRVVGLEDCSSHSDAIFHDVCRAKASPVRILVDWEKMVGWTSQLPGPVALTQLFLNVFRLEPTRANVILPSAIWGWLAILASYWVGCRLSGKWFGLLLMAVVALNPAHVQLSRTAYFYQPCIFGSFALFWCLMYAWDRMKEGKGLGWRFHVAHAVAVGALVYSSPSTWLFVAMACAAMVLFSVIKWRRGTGRLGEIVVLCATYAVLAVPLLLAPWGLEALLRTKAKSEYTEYWRRIFEMQRTKPMWLTAAQEFAKLGWGWTLPRSIVTGAMACLGVVVVWRRARGDARWAFPLILFLSGLLLIFLAMRDSTFTFILRRAAVIWPYGLIILAAGLGFPWLVKVGGKWKSVVYGLWSTGMAFLLGLWLYADVLALSADGFPIPYRRISQWLDMTFPKGTPVVTDRFYTAMCEFNNSDPTTNVVVISTAPNELPEIQEKTRFRELTRQYFEENPDAVFYCARHMYERPEVTPWEWPTTYFRRRQEMRDVAADRLGLLGQNAHMEYPGKQVWPVIYYNKLEDVVAIKRAAGAKGFVMWGPDWRPVQTQDYRLWRLLLTGDTGLKVYNLGDKEQELTLEMTGVAAGGDLRLQLGEQVLGFTANQPVQQRYKLTLKPGMNVVPVRSRGTPNARLLAGKVTVFGLDR